MRISVLFFFFALVAVSNACLDGLLGGGSMGGGGCGWCVFSLYFSFCHLSLWYFSSSPIPPPLSVLLLFYVMGGGMYEVARILEGGRIRNLGTRKHRI